MIDRRAFLRTGTGAAVAVLAPSTLFLTGCSLKGTAQSVLDTLESIYNTHLLPANVEADLGVAIKDAQTALADWNGSSVNCELQSAFTIAGAILDSIPLGTTIDLIITVALAGVNALLADLAPCTTTTLARKLSRAYSDHFHSVTQEYAPYYARFHADSKRHMGADVKSAFDAAAKQ